MVTVVREKCLFGLLGLKSLGDGCHDICKDKDPNLGPVLLRLKLSRVKLYFRFACKMKFLFRVTFEGNIQCAKKGIAWHQPWNALTVINKIVFTSPEAIATQLGKWIVFKKCI